MQKSKLKQFILDLDNVGDSLNPTIMEHIGLGFDGSTSDRKFKGKFVGCGSLMTAVRAGDVVWGTGIMREDGNYGRVKDAKVLAVRGKKTRKVLIDAGAKDVPEIFGDPALLLPLIYNPTWDFGNGQIDVAYMPHYAEKPDFWKQKGKLRPGETFIDSQTKNWKKVVRQIKQADKLVTSSLHGIIIADAYGVPVEWVGYSTDKIYGGKFKFLDYFSITGRHLRKNYGELPPLKPELLKDLQNGLLSAIKDANV